MSELRLGKSYKSQGGVKLSVTNAQGLISRKISARQLLENSLEAVGICFIRQQVQLSLVQQGIVINY